MAVATIVSSGMRGGVAKGKTTDIIEELLNTFRRVDLLLPDCIFNPTKIHAHILTYTLRYKHTHTHTDILSYTYTERRSSRVAG